MKHTPGPWVIRYPEGFKYCIKSSDQLIIATINGVHGDLETTEEHEERHLSDAKLIAAAPDLLEALKEVQSTIESSDHWWIANPSKGGFDWEKIDAAIKKATE